jgi:hypothetical protein
MVKARGKEINIGKREIHKYFDGISEVKKTISKIQV